MRTVCFLLLLLTVSFSVSAQGPKMKPPENAELVCTFGDRDVPDEYLIAGELFRINRYCACVDPEGNFYLYNERRIKVYDADGKPKAIIGGPGQGPGEFDRERECWPTAGPNGHVAAMFRTLGKYSFSVYTPDFKYLKNLYTIDFKGGSVFRMPIIALNDTDYLYEDYEQRRDGNVQYTNFRLKYNSGGAETVIAEYDTPTDVLEGQSDMTLSYLGKLFWGMAGPGTVAYVHSRQDEKIGRNESRLTVHLYELNTGNSSVVSFPFKPFILTEELLKTGGGYGASGGASREKMKRLRTEYLKRNNIRTHEPIISAVFDDMVMYAYSPHIRMEEGFEPERSVYVVDLADGTVLNTIYLPDYYLTLAIKNGYLYLPQASEEGFPQIAKYKLDPVVSGK